MLSLFNFEYCGHEIPCVVENTEKNFDVYVCWIMLPVDLRKQFQLFSMSEHTFIQSSEIGAIYEHINDFVNAPANTKFMNSKQFADYLSTILKKDAAVIFFDLISTIQNKVCRPPLFPHNFSYANYIVLSVRDHYELALLEALTDKIEFFKVPPGHPVYGRDNSLGIRVKEGCRLPANFVIGFYAGEQRPSNKYDESDYMVASECFDGTGVMTDGQHYSNETAFINDCRGTGKRANVQFGDAVLISETSKAYAVPVKTLRVIKSGEELLATYGNNSYWRIKEEAEKGEFKKFDMLVYKDRTTVSFIRYLENGNCWVRQDHAKFRASVSDLKRPVLKFKEGVKRYENGELVYYQDAPTKIISSTSKGWGDYEYTVVVFYPDKTEVLKNVKHDQLETSEAPRKKPTKKRKGSYVSYKLLYLILKDFGANNHVSRQEIAAKAAEYGKKWSDDQVRQNYHNFGVHGPGSGYLNYDGQKFWWTGKEWSKISCLEDIISKN